MLLVIDVGNTNIVFAAYQTGRRRGKWRIVTDEARTADEYAVWLIQLMALAGVDQHEVEAAIMSSVVPDVDPNLRELCDKHFGVRLRAVGDADVDLGLRVLIDRPEQVGADRLVNAVAGHAMYDGPLMLIDFGTATTFEVVDSDGNYHGGVFCPGVRHSVEALYRVAAKLPRIDIRPTPKVIGKATVPAMQSGVFWGYLSMIEGLARRIEHEFGAPMTVIATGGLAELFAPYTESIHHVEPDLTLRGLIQIHQRNKKD